MRSRPMSRRGRPIGAHTRKDALFAVAIESAKEELRIRCTDVANYNSSPTPTPCTQNFWPVVGFDRVRWRTQMS